nr:DUF6701 domain-containing protein [Idiomarina piscisalsi]
MNDQEDAQPGNLIEKAAHILKKYKRLSLKDASVSLVLGTDCYESVLVDRPMVDSEEIADSLKYSLDDLVSLSADDIIADYYEFPEQPTGQDKVVAVVASKQLLKPWVDFLEDNDLSLVAITVSELTLPSLIKPPTHPEMVIYQTQEKQYLAQIYTSKGLLFTRILRGVTAMKQSVNLYRGDLVPVNQRLTLGKLTMGLVVIAVVILALATIAGWQQSQAQAKNEELTEQLNAANNQLTSLRDRLSNRKQSPDLVAKKTELQTYIQDARTFRQSINDFETSASSAVASLLRELADITPQGIWLENFGLNGEKIYLQGYATDTEKLVLWMDKFKLLTAEFDGTCTDFYYMGQPQPVSLSAQVVNASGNKTLNYTGSLAKAEPLFYAYDSSRNQLVDHTVSYDGVWEWGDGVGQFTGNASVSVSRLSSGQPDGPFRNYILGWQLDDREDANFYSTLQNSDLSASYGAAEVDSANLYYGRLNLQDTYTAMARLMKTLKQKAPLVFTEDEIARFTGVS